ncbi:MAG: NAD(P)H-dependent oxidoreductase [Chitinophagaceae bacterium]|nr:NAD(P)H-dependent oxidoreductase [Chitinophagaceae bacterium]
MHIAIISSSVRTGRNSHRVSLFFKKFVEEQKLATTEIIDLLQYHFPIFDERLSNIKEPSAQMLEFAGKIKSADGIIIVTPEYNGGYPASLKNVIDLLYPEWKRKPIALATVSDGPYGGTQVMTSLLFTLWKIGSWVVPAMYRVSKVHEAYDENGNAVDSKIPKFAKAFLDELMWCMEAKRKMAENL